MAITGTIENRIITRGVSFAQINTNVKIYPLMATILYLQKTGVK